MYWYEASEWIKNIPVTRYIASYYIGGGRSSYKEARAWLEQLVIDGDKLTEKEVTLIATCIVEGMLELQENVNMFLLRNKNSDDI